MISRKIPAILSRISPGGKLIVVSNREPAIHERVAEGIRREVYRKGLQSPAEANGLPLMRHKRPQR
jgi:hypothetical protein